MAKLGHAIRGLAAAVLLHTAAASAQSIHFDVTISLDKGPVAGSQIVVGAHGDLPFASLPIDYATGYYVFPGDFGDFEGGPRATDDPGFQAFAGSLSGRAGARDLIGFEALPGLSYWDPASQAWGDAPEGVGIRLYGAIPPAVADAYMLHLLRPALAPAHAVSTYRLYENGTLFTAQGVQGPVRAAIDDASTSGAFHSHLDWFIEGAAPSGAYMLSLRLTDGRDVGGRGLYVDSDPFYVLFNYGLSRDPYQAAFASRLTAPVPEPGSWAMLVAGLALFAWRAHRRIGASA